MKLNLRVIFVSCGLFLSACALAPTNAPRFTSAPAAPEGFATVYISRNYTGTNVATTKFLVAGKPVVDLPLQSYTWVHVKAGTHNIAAEWPIFVGQPNTSGNFKFETGKDHFVRIRTGSDIVRTGAGIFFGGALVVSSALEMLRPEDGRAELIACCGYVKSSVSLVE
jgi:hypothetical protein